MCRCRRRRCRLIQFDGADIDTFAQIHNARQMRDANKWYDARQPNDQIHCHDAKNRRVIECEQEHAVSM